MRFSKQPRACGWTIVGLAWLFACPLPEAESDPSLLEGCELAGCPQMPSAQCADAETRRSYSSNEGRCVEGTCVYDYSDEPCTCRDARCVELPALGEQRTAVILVDAVGDGSAQAAAEIREAIFDGERSVASFIAESSYGRAWLGGAVYGWYPLDTSDDLCLMSDADLIALAAGEVPFAEIDRFVILFHAPDAMCDGLGVSSHGKLAVDTPAGVVQASVARAEISYRLARPTLPHVQLADIAATVIAHELGHSLGITGHANILDCGAASLSTSADDCVQEALADMFTIMGGEGFCRSALHHSACHKKDLGWLADHEIETTAVSALEPGSSASFRLYPFEQTSEQGPLALRILLSSPIDIPTVLPTQRVTITELFVENRAPVGFDAWLDNLATRPTQIYPLLSRSDGLGAPAIDIAGLQIRGGFFKDGHCVTSYLIDPHPDTLDYDGETYSLYDSLDSFLNLGETLYEPNNGLSLTMTEIYEDGSVGIELWVD